MSEAARRSVDGQEPGSGAEAGGEKQAGAPRLATLGELLEAKHQEFVGRIRERERRSE